MTAYYNEFEPYAAAWLRNLIADGLIPAGDVDERSITDVRGSDLAGYTQCHFFAGIGGWAYALRLAGWGDRPVWTGSCPCQPFSAAGKRKGTADERHLWPEFFRLIAECGPPTVFGEQVASKDGRAWLAGVRADLEGVGYGVGAADLCAASVGAPHIRQRLWWVADASIAELRPEPSAGHERRDGKDHRDHHGLAESEGEQHDRSGAARGWRAEPSDGCGLEHPEGDGRLEGWSEPSRGSAAERRSPDGWVGDTSGEGLAQRPESVDGRGAVRIEGATAPPAGAWDGGIWITGADGKARRVEPSIRPLAHGVPARVGKLRAYGNAIVPQVAAEFIRAFALSVANGGHHEEF